MRLKRAWTFFLGFRQTLADACRSGQDHLFDPVGMLRGEINGDASAEGMRHHTRLGDRKRFQQAGDLLRVFGHAPWRRRLAALAVAGKSTVSTSACSRSPFSINEKMEPSHPQPCRSKMVGPFAFAAFV